MDLLASAELFPAEPAVHRDVLGHGRIRVEAQLAEAAPAGFERREVEQGAAEALTLAARVDSQVVDQQVAVLRPQEDAAGNLPIVDDPELTVRAASLVVVVHRRWPATDPRHVVSVRALDEIGDRLGLIAPCRPDRRRRASGPADEERRTETRADAGAGARLDERHDRAAEAAAGHSCSDGPRRKRVGDEPVELGRRHLEVVAQARMTRGERASKRLVVAGLERLDNLEHALVLRADMTQAARIAGLDLGAALRIPGLVESPRRTGVDHEELQVVRKRHVPVLARPAVEEQRMPGTREQGGSLVHEPAGHADRTLFGAPAGLGELETIGLDAGRIAECERNRHLERGRRREASSRGQIRDDPSVEAGADAELLSDGPDVAKPALVGGEPVRLQLDHRRGLADNRDPTRDRRGEDEPTGVVRVLADQVDAAGRAEQASRAQRAAARTISAGGVAASQGKASGKRSASMRRAYCEAVTQPCRNRLLGLASGVSGEENACTRAKGGVMPGKRASVKDEKQYEALKDKGMSKERAAKIANSPRASSRGGKRSGSGSSSKQGGTTAQKKAAGRKGGKAAARKS